MHLAFVIHHQNNLFTCLHTIRTNNRWLLCNWLVICVPYMPNGIISLKETRKKKSSFPSGNIYKMFCLTPTRTISFYHLLLNINCYALTPSKGPLWSWSYGSWVYNYLCIRCLSPLMLWVRIPLMARCTRYIIMW